MTLSITLIYLLFLQIKPITMKKTFTLLLLIAITMIMAIIATGCKSRKLNKESVSIVDKTKTEESAQVKEQITDSKVHQGTKESKITDQSGTWIWEEWYERDKDADTLISPISGHLLYKRTTYIKNDINKTERAEIADFENHSEIKDSTGTQTIQKDIKSESKTKDLEAEKAGNGWIYGLVILIGLIAVVLYFLKISKAK